MKLVRCPLHRFNLFASAINEQRQAEGTRIANNLPGPIASLPDRHDELVWASTCDTLTIGVANKSSSEQDVQQSTRSDVSFSGEVTLACLVTFSVIRQGKPLHPFKFSIRSLLFGTLTVAMLIVGWQIVREFRSNIVRGNPKEIADRLLPPISKGGHHLKPPKSPLITSGFLLRTTTVEGNQCAR